MNEKERKAKEEQKRQEGRKGGQGWRKGRLSSGQVQLTLNCLALELEHLGVPEGVEEWRVDTPPSEHLFFSLLPDSVSCIFRL